MFEKERAVGLPKRTSFLASARARRSDTSRIYSRNNIKHYTPTPSEVYTNGKIFVDDDVCM